MSRPCSGCGEPLFRHEQGICGACRDVWVEEDDGWEEEEILPGRNVRLLTFVGEYAPEHSQRLGLFDREDRGAVEPR